MERSAAESTAMERIERPSFLDRTIDLGRIGWATVAWVAVAATAVAVRLANLDVWALAAGEAERAYNAFSLYTGNTSAAGQAVPTTEPLFLLLQTFGFFLFGATDATARIAPALCGLALVLLPLGLRPFVGKPAALGMAALAAFSPTLVYTSRTADPQIVVACAALLLVVAVLQAGRGRRTSAADDVIDVEGSTRRWALVGGVALGAMLAAGPSSISVLLSLAAGTVAALVFDPDRQGAVRRGLVALSRTPGALLAFLAAFVATVVALFTRFFSDLGAIVGTVHTVGDWGELIATGATTTPTQFYLLAVLLYEPLALVLALVAAFRGRASRSGGLGWPFFAGWFVTSLLLFSFSAGRAPQHATLVALPLILLGGAALGDLLAAIDWRDALRGQGGALALALLGLVVAVTAFVTLVRGIDSAVDQSAAVFQTVIVAALVIVPLAFAVFTLVRAERQEGRRTQPLAIALLVLAVLLGGYTLRSAVMLNFYTADDGTEFLAQRTATGAVRPLVDRIRRLSRDATVTQGSVRDVTGGHGLSIAADRRVQWPFRWYFRDFPDFEVVPDGQAPASAAQIVMAPDDAGMAEAGYTPRAYPYLNRVPASFVDPDSGAILANLFWPPRWADGLRYVLYRELDTETPPETVAVGLNGELAARVSPNSGPFNLLDRPGAGSGRGQFNQPRDIAVDPVSGTIYVVDMGNARVERFDAAGGFVGIWGDGESGGAVAFELTENGLGPTGIDVGDDGLVYVADTWNHRIVALDASGASVREFGTFGDTEDATSAATDVAGFFGPRDVVVDGDEIFVVDTGNERIQVFSSDFTFKRAWGGYGSEPEQFIEPVGIAIGPDGQVYVADSGNGRISVFDRQGSPLAQWPVAAWEGQAFFEPYLAFGPDGYLYATSSATGSVEVLAPDGSLVESIVEVGGEPLQRPIGIAAHPDGTILISDTGLNAVFRYVPPPAPAPPAEEEPAIDSSPAASPIASPGASPAATPRANG